MSMDIHMALTGIGDMILIRLGEKRRKLNLLLDTGNTKADFLNILDTVLKRDELIDYLVITHDDGDHVNGLSFLMREIEEKGRSKKNVAFCNTKLKLN